MNTHLTNTNLNLIIFCFRVAVMMHPQNFLLESSGKVAVMMHLIVRTTAKQAIVRLIILLSQILKTFGSEKVKMIHWFDLNYYFAKFIN